MKELTYPKNKFEVIVIDDESTDRTGEKAERFTRNYSFVWGEFIKLGILGFLCSLGFSISLPILTSCIPMDPHFWLC
jgi:glycosyltransferase involved in cell wall biosynthesis